jgi:TRAP-type uncharacterized transport system fused permease subunit
MPAFVVPFVFTLRPAGTALLLQGSWLDILRVAALTAAGLAVIAAAAGGYFFRPATWLHRTLLVAAGGLLLALI